MSRFYYVPDICADLSCRETLSESEDDEAILKEWDQHIAAHIEGTKEGGHESDTDVSSIYACNKIAEPLVSTNYNNIQKLSDEVLEQYPSIIQLLPLGLSTFEHPAIDIFKEPSSQVEKSPDNLEIVAINSVREDRSAVNSPEPETKKENDICPSQETTNIYTEGQPESDNTSDYESGEISAQLMLENESVNLTMDNSNIPEGSPSTSTPVSSSRSLETILARELLSTIDPPQELDDLSLSPIEIPLEGIRDDISQAVPSVDADFHMGGHLRDNVNEVYDDSEIFSDEDDQEVSIGSLDYSASLYLDVTIEE